jgi:hypothetical protein
LGLPQTASEDASNQTTTTDSYLAVNAEEERRLLAAWIDRQLVAPLINGPTGSTRPISDIRGRE